MLKRTPSDKKPKRAAARSTGTWARARRWINRLLGRPVEPAPKVTQGRASVLERSEVDGVRRDLTAVLDQHPKTRSVARYVGALENGLQRRGRHALDELPVDVIRKAMQQLDTLVTDWSTPGLTTLRSKAAMAIANRERVEAQRAEARRPVQADVEVEESSVTTFMAANEEWERSFPGTTGAVPLEPSAVAEGRAQNAALPH